MPKTLDPPACQYCKHPMHLAGEDEHSWQWVCLRDSCVRVYTKPRAAEAAKYQVRQNRKREAEELYRRLTSRPKYFFMGGNS